MKKLSITFSLLLTISASVFAGEKDQDKNQDRDVLILTDKDKVTDPALIDQLNKMIANDRGGTNLRKDGDCVPPSSFASTFFISSQTPNKAKLKPHCLEYADIHIDDVDGDYDSLVEFMDYSVAETFFAYQYEYVSGPSSCETDGVFADPVWFYGNSSYTGPVTLELDDPLTMMVNGNCQYQVQLITARQNSDGSTSMGGYSNWVDIVNNF